MIRYHGNIAFIDRPNTELEHYLDSIYERVPGHLQWKVPHKGAIQLATEFFKTITSGLCTDIEFENRKQKCLSCPAMVQDNSGIKYCSGCRCGRWQLAQLDGTFLPKLRWASLRCPLGRF